MKKLFPLLFIAISLAACTESTSETPNEESVEAPANNHMETEASNVSNEESMPQTLAFHYYEGRVGIYQQQVIYELTFDGDNVNGTYFYARHQKKLNLSGKIDSTSMTLQLTESYKGKSTGYFEGKLNDDGTVTGVWKATKNAQREEEFNMIPLFISDEQMIPEHSRYESEHSIVMYGGPEETEEDMTDYCTVSTIGDSYLIFDYHVTATNGHMGSADGLAKLDGNQFVFIGEEGCELALKFRDKELQFETLTNCQYYHGARAHLDNVLEKVK